MKIITNILKNNLSHTINQNLVNLKRDKYSALHITPKQKTNNDITNIIKTNIQQSLNNKTSSIWVHLNKNNLDLINWLINQHQFVFHHSKGTDVKLYRWINKQKIDKIPPYSMFIVGCGGIIINKQRLLLICEKAGQLKGRYGIPGGRADFGQGIKQCSERQIFQEIGLKTDFNRVLWMRQLSNYLYDAYDMYFGCLMHVKDQQLKNIKLCADQVQKIQWVHLKQLKQFMDKNSFGTQRQLSQHIFNLYQSGFDFNKQSNYKGQFYSSPLDNKRRYFGQHKFI